MLASAQQRDKVIDYIRLGIKEGATLVAGGPEAPEGLDQGYFVKATVFGNVKPESRLAQEEIFGPVLCIIPYTGEAEAIRIANGTAYGLSGAVFPLTRKRRKRSAASCKPARYSLTAVPSIRWRPSVGSGIPAWAGNSVNGAWRFWEVRALQL